jgi:hypothetical protein
MDKSNGTYGKLLYFCCFRGISYTTSDGADHCRDRNEGNLRLLPEG